MALALEQACLKLTRLGAQIRLVHLEGNHREDPQHCHADQHGEGDGPGGCTRDLRCGQLSDDHPSCLPAEQEPLQRNEALAMAKMKCGLRHHERVRATVPETESYSEHDACSAARGIPAEPQQQSAPRCKQHAGGYCESARVGPIVERTADELADGVTGEDETSDESCLPERNADLVSEEESCRVVDGISHIEHAEAQHCQAPHAEIREPP